MEISLLEESAGTRGGFPETGFQRLEPAGYSTEDLMSAAHGWKFPPRDTIILNQDPAQTGLGGDTGRSDRRIKNSAYRRARRTPAPSG